MSSDVITKTQNHSTAAANEAKPVRSVRRHFQPNPDCPILLSLLKSIHFYLRVWHSSLRLLHSTALPVELHMYTLLNHPSVI